MFIHDVLHSGKFFRPSVSAVFLLFILSSQSARAQTNPADDLTQLSIEKLMTIDISSVGKKDQKISETAAAVYVITQEDIRRSGLNSIPELLRMVPGLDVERIDSSEWAISSRGFNARRSKKLLVLIDGRSLYWPAYGNVFWETQNLMLEDIERIEVIRGPGATLWGTGAVNGVVNIISKQSKDTQGSLISAGVGTQERGFAAARFGGQVGSKGHYRMYARGFKNSDFITPTGSSANDSWNDVRGGFRSDWNLSKRDTLTVQGDLYRGTQSHIVNLISLQPPFSSYAGLQTEVHGGNLQGRWSRIYSSHTELSLRAYYDSDTRDSSETGLFVRTGGFDFQHRFALGERHDLLWGAGYRYAHDSIRNTFQESFQPPTRNESLYNAFILDEITLIRNRLHLTLGIRFEIVPYTGYDSEPNSRLLWNPSKNQTIWFSVASAKLAPTRASRESRASTAISVGPDGTPSVKTRFGSVKFRAEDILAFDLGYRLQPTRRISLDLATFYNRYRHLLTVEPGRPYLELSPPPTHIIIPRYYANLMLGKSYGGEISLAWKVTNAWKLNASYSFLRLALRRSPESLATDPERAEGDNPRNQVWLRSQWNLSSKFDFDQSVYFAGRLFNQDVPAYTRVDLRLGWRPSERIELSIVGQNLLSPNHAEYNRASVALPTLDGRKAYGKLTWKF